MKKPVFPRIIGLCALYGVVFIVIVMIQFSRQGNFSHWVGSLLVTGQSPEGAGPMGAGPEDTGEEYPLTGTARVFFGGLELLLGPGPGDSSLAVLGEEGGREPVLPEAMTISGETLFFRLPGGAALAFTTGGGEQPELQIDGYFVGGHRGLELPYRPQRGARLGDAGDGQLTVSLKGLNYRFVRGELDPERRILTLRPGNAVVSYGAFPEQGAFDPRDFSLPAAQGRVSFEQALSRWRDQCFALWSVPGRADEDQVIAYGSEALRRGTYKTALAGLSSALGAGQRTYQSSVYTGRLEEALVSLSRGEAEKTARLSALLRENSPDFFREPQGLEYLAVRGMTGPFDQVAALARSMDPSALEADLIPGILEGFSGWKRRRPGQENPFEGLIEGALELISGDLRKSSGGEQVLFFPGGEAGAEFNLRLGKALMDWGEGAGNEPWAAVGRSLILSILALQDAAGTVPGALRPSAGTFAENPAVHRPAAARLYRLLEPGEYYPRALEITPEGTGLWAWTAASAISAEEGRDSMEITVSFLPGETHYLLIRGLRPFVRVQIHNIEYRQDSQFERYDASGWTYSRTERTMLLKIKHRDARERINITFNLPPPPAPPPEELAEDPEAAPGEGSGPETPAPAWGLFQN